MQIPVKFPEYIIALIFKEYLQEGSVFRKVVGCLPGISPKMKIPTDIPQKLHPEVQDDYIMEQFIPEQT